MPWWFQGFLTYIPYPIANSVYLLHDRWDVGCESFPAGTHLALKRWLSPADINSGMLQGIPFQKSSVMLEMLVAIVTVGIFMMKSWELQNFKTRSDPKCDCGCWHETKFGDLNQAKLTGLVLVDIVRHEADVLLRHSKTWNSSLIY